MFQRSKSATAPVGHAGGEPNSVSSPWSSSATAKLTRAQSAPACSGPPPVRCKVRPGRFSFYVFGLCFICFFLDCLSLMPHPMGPLLGGLGDSQAESPTGLTQHEIRKRYHERLETWRETAVFYKEHIEKGTVLQLERDLPKRGCSNCSASPWCRLAEASIQERYSARVQARRYGTFVMHLELMIRDWFVYGSGYYDVQKFLKGQMRKMKKTAQENGKEPPAEEDICKKVVASSVKANAEYDKEAEYRANMTYTREALYDWIGPTIGLLALVVVVYALEFTWRFTVRKLSSD